MKNLLFTLVALGTTFGLFAQNVGIGTNTPDESAKLEVRSADKGVLLPQVDLDTTVFAGGPATGLLVWNTNLSFGSGQGYYYNDGTKLIPNWVRMEKEPNTGLSDVGVIAAFPGSSYPNDIYLPLDGGTYNKADFPAFAAIIASLDATVVSDGASTFTLADWNSNAEFLRGQGAGAAGIGVLQTDATARPSVDFITDNLGAHIHSVDPPNTSTSTTGNHTHTVDPPNTSTSTNGNHNHDFRTATNDVNSSSSQGYPAGNNHNAFRTTDRNQEQRNNNAIVANGNHTHTLDIGAFNSSAAGNHAHSVDIGSFNSASNGDHAHSIIGGGDTETRPVNRSITWVIKVKPSASSVGDLTINNIMNTPPDADWYKVGTTDAPTINNEDIFTEGKVGIGLIVPSNTLTINGSANDTEPILGLRSGNTSSSFNDGAQIAFGYNGTDDYQHFIQTRHNSGNADNAIDFYTSDGTQNNTLSSGSLHTLSMVSGKVGIAKTDPAEALDVVGNVQLTGDIISPKFNATQVWNQNSALPGASSFTSGGGTIIVMMSGSGYRTGAGVIGMNLLIDGITRGSAKSFTNESASHKAFTNNYLVITGLAAGAHSIQLNVLAGTSTDFNDFFSVSILELPF